MSTQDFSAKNYSLSFTHPFGIWYFLTLPCFIFGEGNRQIIQSLWPISTMFPGVYEKISIVICSFDYLFKKKNERPQRKTFCFFKIFVVIFQNLTRLFNRRNLASICFLFLFVCLFVCFTLTIAFNAGRF